MKFKVVTLFSILISFTTLGQNNITSYGFDCNNYEDALEDYGDKLYSLSDWNMQSSAINEFTAYTLNGKYYAIVRFKSSNQDYVYCELPKKNLESFKSKDEPSYGKKFYRYINSYKCDCR
jgi:hypothetical protein